MHTVWVKDRHEDREDHDVDIFIIQKVRDPANYLKGDEKQWKITKEVRGKPSGYGPHVRCQVYGYQIFLMHKKQTTVHAFRPETIQLLVVLFFTFFTDRASIIPSNTIELIDLLNFHIS